MTRFQAIFLFDALLNVGSGVFAMVFPDAFMAQFVAGPLPPMAASAVPWFGVMLFVVGFIEWRLVERGDRDSLVGFMQGFLVGDFLYIWAFAGFVAEAGVWNLSSFLSVGTTGSFCLIRLYYLFARPERIASRAATRSASAAEQAGAAQRA